MKSTAHIIGCLTLGLLLTIFPNAADAQFSAKDGQVLGRTLGYVGDGMTGVAVVGIVIAAGSPASRQEAELIQAVIGDGLTTGRVRLQARLVAAEEVGGVIGVQALYLTSGLSGNMAAVLAAAQRLRVPTVSTDTACVLAGNCVIGFSSEPTVQIILNQGTAEHIGVHFLQAFRMLVREK